MARSRRNTRPVYSRVMRCTGCGADLLAGKRFCHACGTRAAHTCPGCGAAVEEEFRFCPECGTSLEPRAAGERKRVTVLFCDLAGSTAAAERLDPEEYRELLDRYLELSFAEIDRFEGVVNQLAGDGFMALFGAPVAREDAPERAIHAALAICHALRDFALRPRIGVHTGMVVVGTVGTDHKMDYTAIGDTTNLAARLEAVAEPGTILASEATRRLVRGRFRLEPRGPFTVKGKSEPVTAYQVLGVREQAEARQLTRFVGRAQELAHLEAAFERVTGSLAQVVAVVGDAGSGKSRLVHEFERSLADRPVELFTARCASLSRDVPGALWVDMMRRYFGLSPGEPSDDSLRKLHAGLVRSTGEEAEQLEPAFRRMLSLPCEGSMKRPFEAVERLVLRASQRAPVVMIVEDLHWIDDASRQALELAVSRLGAVRVLIVVTHRPDYEARWQSAAVTQLHLRSLPEAEASEIVRAVAGGALPADLEARIVRQGVGNPFFLEELTRGLIEDGTLVREDGAVAVTRPVHEVRIPDSLHELLGARLDRLPVPAKRVAQVAAVLGRQFASEALAALVGGDAAPQLAELERRGIVRRTGEGEFRFGESVTQEVAYQTLLLKERRRLHGRAARLFEKGEKAVLAYHYARSDERERGVELMLEAALEAEQLPSYGDAVRLFRESWELAEAVLADRTDDERLQRQSLRATEGLCRVMVLYGSPEDAEEDRVARRGEELAEALNEPDSLANLHALHGMLLVGGSRDRYEQGVTLIEKGLRVAREAGRDGMLPRLRRALGWAYLLDGRFEEAVQTTEAALAAFEPLSDAWMGTRFVKNQMLLQTDDFAGAEEFARETHTFAGRAGNRTLGSASGSIVASLRFVAGDYDEAGRWAERALAIAEEIDNLVTLRNATAVLVGIRCERGDRNVSSLELERLERGLLRGGDLALNVDQIVELLLELGKLDAARRIAEGAASRSGAHLRRMTSVLALGAVEARSGPNHWSAAQRALGEAIALARRLRLRAPLAKGLLGLAGLAAAQGEPEVARRHAASALPLFRELGLGHYKRRAERLRSSAR